MSKFGVVDNRKGYFIFNCLGCKCDHFVNTNPEFGTCWEWNGSLEKPTVSPSILVGANLAILDGSYKVKRCHSFIRDGKIQYLNDCDHELAGKTIELPNYSTDL